MGLPNISFFFDSASGPVHTLPGSYLVYAGQVKGTPTYLVVILNALWATGSTTHGILGNYWLQSWCEQIYAWQRASENVHMKLAWGHIGK